jgi:pantoate kinase
MHGQNEATPFGDIVAISQRGITAATEAGRPGACLVNRYERTQSTVTRTDRAG